MTRLAGMQPRPSVAGLAGYEWEESSEAVAVRFGLDVSDVVRFDMNTVPWQLPVEDASAPPLNEYPDTSYRKLVAAIAGYCGQPAERIVVGAGADELISLVAQSFLDNGRTFAFSDPTYPLFAISSRIAGAEHIQVDCGADFGVDREGLLSAARNAQVTWLANPNNPTGELLTQGALRKLAAAARGLVVIDEAYAEFVDDTALAWAASAPNVAVIRTFSKAFGLAGIRVGDLVASPDVVATLNTVRPANSIAVTSANLACDALGWVDVMREHVRQLIDERKRLATELAESGRRIVNGAANFLLAEMDPSEVERAMSRGLVVRTFGGGHRLSRFARVTVRSRNDDDRLIAELRTRR
jgi:histidinol-phosphate aminotransferase